MKEVLLLLLGALISAIAFLGKRALKKDRVSEAITRKSELLALMEKMRTSGVSMEELDAFEAQFDRRQHVREIEDRLTIELKTEELAIRPGPGETQAEMNTTARERYERASIRLHLIRDGLLRLLSPTNASCRMTRNELGRHTAITRPTLLLHSSKEGPFSLLSEQPKSSVSPLSARQFLKPIWSLSAQQVSRCPSPPCRLRHRRADSPATGASRMRRGLSPIGSADYVPRISRALRIIAAPASTKASSASCTLICRD